MAASIAVVAVIAANDAICLRLGRRQPRREHGAGGDALARQWARRVTGLTIVSKATASEALLAVPQPLEGGDPPRYEGALEIEAGPERIESGWWDGAEARRDYFIARNARGQWLWIYRDLAAPRGWFLHGLFA